MCKSIRNISIFMLAVVTFGTNFHHVEARMTLDQIQNMMKPISKTCIGKTGVAKELVDGTRSGAFPPDSALMCYEACLLKMMKSLTKDGKIAPDSMIKQIEMMMQEDLVDRSVALVKKCVTESTSEDKCEVSWQFVKCFYDSDTDLYFFP